MCRWFAYSGSPVPVETFLPQAESRLIHQSPHARLGSVTTSGNGFEMSSYREGGPPGFHRTASPAWDDQDLILSDAEEDGNRLSPAQLASAFSEAFKDRWWEDDTDDAAA